jgi:hypothetical protein
MFLLKGAENPVAWSKIGPRLRHVSHRNFVFFTSTQLLAFLFFCLSSGPIKFSTGTVLLVVRVGQGLYPKAMTASGSPRPGRVMPFEVISTDFFYHD